MRNFTKSTVYQIYTKSFMDTNNDGIGDIKGVIQKLDYIKSLGVDYIWMTPFYKSPLKDNGYDVADYYSIDPVFGTMDDFKELVQKAKDMDMGIILDMVFNHTSIEHEWFQKALQGEKKYMDYYIFHDPVNGKEPTNWQSKFGSSAWQYVPHLNKYYLHLFDVTQADLNWDNKEVREELKKIVLFWKDLGIEGFRFDVINLISKPESYISDFLGDGRRFYTDGPKAHDYINELVRDTQIDDMLTIGEMSSTTVKNCIDYTNPNRKELKMSFVFHHLKVDYRNGNKWNLMDPDISKLKNIINKWQEGMQEGGGWNALFLSDHDQPRAVSRFCKHDHLNDRCSKMLATVIHLLRGTPYIYQGEEIGMTNCDFTDISSYRDVESLNSYKRLTKKMGKSDSEAMEIINARSRDNSRTPMQWNTNENAGFSNSTPWIDVNKNYMKINVQSQIDDENSVLSFYKRLIYLRKTMDIISDGNFSKIDDMPNDVFAYERSLSRESLKVFANFSNQMQDLFNMKIDGYDLIISNVDTKLHIAKLQPYEVAVYYRK